MANNFANSQDLIAVKDIRDGIAILTDDSLRQVVIVGGVNFSLKSEQEQNILTQLYQNFLNGLNFPIQIIVHSRKINIEKYLAVLEGRQSQELAPLLQSQINEYREFVRSFVQENAIMTKTFFVVVPFAPVNLPSKTGFMNMIPFRKKTQEKPGEEEKDFHEHVGQLKQRTAQIIDGLSAIGLEAVALNNESLVELFYNFYNPGTVERDEVVTKK